MIVAISHQDWQILRALARAEAAGGEHPTGRELRVAPTRRTADGTFLDDLVTAGLIAVAAKPGAAPPTLPGQKPEPAQFRTRYKLAEKGRHAAEYGEYELAFTPRADAPLTGLAAELMGPLIAKAARWRQPAADGTAKVTGKKRPKR